MTNPEPVNPADTNVPPIADSSPGPVWWLASVYSVLLALNGVALVTDLWGTKTAGYISLATLVVGAVVSQPVRNRTTPWEDVAAKRIPSGIVVAGPAASQPTGTNVEVQTTGGNVLSDPVDKPVEQSLDTPSEPLDPPAYP